MVVSPQHFKEVTNGYEKRSDGLYIHRGKMDIGSLRVTNNLTPLNGQGVEIINDATYHGIIQSFNRDTGTYRDLNLYARNITLSAQSGGKVTLPAGTASALLGQYGPTALGWTLATTGAWTETPMQVNVTSTGAQSRIEYTVMVTSTTSAAVYTGMGTDGSLVAASMAVGHVPFANAVMTLSTTLYYTIPAGSHRVAVFMYVTQSASIWNGGYSALWVTEQRA